jgi:Bacterial aa3 type cytochrome c oxidase subunit IV
MAIAHEPTSTELLRREEWSRGHDDPSFVPTAHDFDEHLKTYKGFVFWAGLFIAHIAVILILLAYFLIR